MYSSYNNPPPLFRRSLTRSPILVRVKGRRGAHIAAAKLRNQRLRSLTCARADLSRWHTLIHLLYPRFMLQLLCLTRAQPACTGIGTLDAARGGTCANRLHRGLCLLSTTHM